MGASRADHLYGRNAVNEVLRAGRRRVHKLWVAEGVDERGTLGELLSRAEHSSVPVERVGRKVLDRTHPNHQGVVASATPYPYATLDEIVMRAMARGEAALVLLLDQVQDPQNLGTLLRTAEAVGVDGVVMPSVRSAGVTPAVVSASSGASEHLWIASGNLVQAIRMLKDAGLWIVGLENSPGAESFGSVDLSGPVGLVVGSEGRGIRRLVLDNCDRVVCIPMYGQIGSLNAAVAGSILLYAMRRVREGALPAVDNGKRRH